MKLFNNPAQARKVKQFRDKLAAATVLALAATCTALGALWLLGAVFRVVFKAMGVA